MLLGEPATTQYDLHFSVLGYTVRISVWFWLVGLLFGSQLIANIPNVPPWRAYLLWTSAILLSILIHELGHCLAFKKHGLHSRIVLYHFGGIAIPSSRVGHRSTNHTPWNQLEISAAGPLLQIVSALALSIVIRLFGFSSPGFSMLGRVGAFFDNIFQTVGLQGGQPIPSSDLYYFVLFYMLVSIGWGIFNLFPVYPLDGGQIARSLGVIMFGEEGIRYSLILSIVVGGYITITSFQSGNGLMGMMFGSLAYSSYQALQATRGSYRPW